MGRDDLLQRIRAIDDRLQRARLGEFLDEQQVDGAQPGKLVVDRSANRLRDECDDPCLVGCGQVFERERGRPHVAVVERRFVAEA